jgi:hypothetical protein
MVITSDCGGSLHLKAENSNENSEWFAAVQMRDKSSLTVGGNAQVTAVISGRYSWYDGVYTYYDHLTAILGDDTLNAIAVTQNATLTTQIPEGAVSGGAELQENGFSGIDNIASIAVSDNAVLNTSRIRVNSFKQTGGIVTVSAQDVWTETVFADIYEDGEIVGTEEVTKANYQCIEVAGEFVISGGKLILDADPAMSEHDWVAALRIENGGSVTISDNADVVIQMSTAGNAIEVGSWPNESNPDFDPTGTFTIAGGKLNVTAAEKNNVTGIQTTPHGTVNILGGATELSNVKIRNEGTMNIGSADQTDAEITVNYDATHDQWQHTVSNAGELNVYSGTWNMSGRNMFSVFAQEGVYNQTGGTVNVTSEYDEKLNRDELGLVFAVENLKTFHLSGGELNAKGEYAIRSVPNWEDVSKQSVFTVSGGTLNADAEQVGIQLFNTDADITGGNVNINVTGAQGLGIVAGPIYGPEQQYFVTDLDITGGNHTITAKIGEGAASVALYSYLSPVDIVGNVSLVLQGTVPMQSTGNSAEDPCYITMAEGITVKGLSTYALRGPKKSEQLSLKPGSEIINDTSAEIKA